jgi:hypothetical protein
MYAETDEGKIDYRTPANIFGLTHLDLQTDRLHLVPPVLGDNLGEDPADTTHKEKVFSPQE